MLGLQVAIGALNDVVDAAGDAVSKPAKPIPAGLVTRRSGLVVAGGGAAAGIALSAVSGLPTLLVGAACLGLGWLYDLRLSRTALSWLPLALALPLLPIHAWIGAVGAAPSSLSTLVPIGVLGGAGLALANGLVDIERDASSGRAAASVVFGRRRTWLVQTALLGAAAILALLLAPGRSGDGLAARSAIGAVRAWGIPAGGMALALGAAILLAARPGVRERRWELEAVGAVLLGIGWLAGVAVSVGG